MNEFKESMSVSRENSGKIIITETLKKLLIELMQGKISKQEVMNLTGIGDKKTIEIKIQEIVSENPELRLLYEEYMARKSTDFNGYNFRPEAIEMLRNNYSQSYMAEKICVSRRTFSTKIKQLAEKNQDNILGQLLSQHAERQMKRQELTDVELIRVNVQLDEYEEKYPVGKIRYEKIDSIEARKDNVCRIIDTVEALLADGYTLKELSEKGIISEAGYRRYKEEAINLSKILEDESKGEK